MVILKRFSQLCGVAAVLIGAILLVGCPPKGKTTFYNRTGRDISVVWGDHVTNVPSQSFSVVQSFDLPSTLVIKSAKGTWKYRFRLLPDDFTRPTFDFGLRIDPGGRIFALQPPGAAVKYDAQPSGYPLNPD